MHITWLAIANVHYTMGQQYAEITDRKPHCALFTYSRLTLVIFN